MRHDVTAKSQTNAYCLRDEEQVGFGPTGPLSRFGGSTRAIPEAPICRHTSRQHSHNKQRSQSE
jgi:hypothetical protein